MPLTSGSNELSFEEILLKATAENNMELLRYSLDNLPVEEKQNAINKALYQASYSETTTVATIRYLIASGGNVKFTPSSGTAFDLDPSLFKIIISKKPIPDKIELVNLWIENGENINTGAFNGANLLFFFQSWEDETLRNFVLSKGADASFRSPFDDCSIYSHLIKDAAYYNRIDLIDYAIERMAEPEKTQAINEALNFSFKRENITIYTIRHLIDKGGDVSFIPRCDTSLLHNAIYRDTAKIEEKIELVKLLLAKGIDINILDFYGNSILSVAKVWKNEALRDFLLENGANPSIINEFGNSILMSPHFSSSISPSILLFIKNLGVDLDHIKDGWGSALHTLIYFYISYREDKESVKDAFSSIRLLLESGVTIGNSLISQVFSSGDENFKKLFELTANVNKIFTMQIKNAESNINFSEGDFPAGYHDFVFNRLTSLFLKNGVPNDFNKYVNDKLTHLSLEFKAKLLFAHKTSYYVNKIYDLEEPEFNGLSLDEQKDKLTALEKEQIIKLLKEKITIEGIPTKGSYNEMFYHYISEDADDLTRFIAGSFVEEMHQELVDSIELFLASYLHLVDNEHFPSPAPYSKLKASSSLEASADVIKALQSYEDKLKGSSIVKFFNNLISKSSFELTSIDEANVENYKHLNMLIKQINSNSLMPKQAKTHLKEIQKAFNLAVIKYEVNAAEALEATHADSAVLDESEDESDDGNDIAETSENAATGGAEQLHETYIPISEVSIVGDVSSS